MSSVTLNCKQCASRTIIDLDPDKLARWRRGELIQNVFPELSKETRELMISEICGSCFEEMFR